MLVLSNKVIKEVAFVVSAAAPEVSDTEPATTKVRSALGVPNATVAPLTVELALRVASVEAADLVIVI